MKKKINMGPTDRIIRGVIGVLLLFLAMYLYSIWSIIPVVFAIGLIFTAVFGYCGLYKLLGFNTLSERQRETRDKKKRKEAKKRLKRMKKRKKKRG